MTSKSSSATARIDAVTEELNHDRRHYRRHDMENQGITVDRWDASRRSGRSFGRLIDLSASGVRIRAGQCDVKPDQQIRVRLELPAYAGIRPFIGGTGSKLEGRNDWVGWVAVTRVVPVGANEVDIAGQLVDMDEMDQGMLGLYLSTQPLAAA